jgi:pyruvate/2-oxoacid:ferredoxin oxidoreductase beta subunit
MKSDIFIARLAHGAVASAVATFLATKSQASATPVPAWGHESAYIDHTIMPEEGTQSGPGSSLVLTLTQSPNKWDKQMEREFRELALKEASDELTSGEAQRLAELNYWRDRLVNPQAAEEILRQIKRDRIVEKMQDLLKEYVEFQESTSQKRASAS